MDYDLPNGWVYMTLRGVVENQKGKVPKEFSDVPQEGFAPYIDIAVFETGKIKRYAAIKNTTITKNEDVLVVWDGSRFGLAGKFSSGVLGSTLVRLSSDIIEQDYLLNFIKYHYKTINSRPRGTGTPHIEPDVFWPLNIGIPPLNEQRRIVEKIETLFARLDAGEAALKKVQTLLARYRQSVLKAAVTGELTQDWRAQNAGRAESGHELLQRILKTRRDHWQGRGKYKEPIAPDTRSLPELPEGWAWASLAQLTDIKGGITVNGKDEPRNPLTFPYLRVKNVQNGYFDLSEIKEITVNRDKAAQCLLKSGDVLLNEGGDRDKLGRGWVWNAQITPCIHQNHVFRARPILPEISSKFISYYANAFGRPYFMLKGKQSVNLASISLTAISGLPIPLPSTAEQYAIVVAIEAHAKDVTGVMSVCHSELARSKALRQSILKQAFAGRLVPQDPNDEPASELLARIRAECQSTSDNKRRRSSTLKKQV